MEVCRATAARYFFPQCNLAAAQTWELSSFVHIQVSEGSQDSTDSYIANVEIYYLLPQVGCEQAECEGTALTQPVDVWTVCEFYLAYIPPLPPFFQQS